MENTDSDYQNKYKDVVDHCGKSWWSDISESDRVIGREIKWLKENDKDKLARVIGDLSEEEAKDIQYNVAIWARDKQLVDFSSPYTITCYMAGRGFGKTFTLSATVKRAVEHYGVRKITILTQTTRDIRATVVPEILERWPDGDENKPSFKGNLNTMEFPNGAKILFISAESGENAPRGTQCELLLGDEVAFYGYNEGIVTQALLTCRLGMSRAYFFTTPKATPLIQQWLRQSKDPDQSYIQVVNGSTFDNEANLSKTFIETSVSAYKGTRLERVELYGELILEAEGALWSGDLIDAHKVSVEDIPDLVEISIGVDPSISSKKAGNKGRQPDDVGIVVSGMGDDGRVYVIENRTSVMPVDKWVKVVMGLYDKYAVTYKAKIVMEQNAGGVDLLSKAFDNVRHGFSKHIHFQFSSQSKMQRAMPYALLTEQGKVKFADKQDMLGLWDEMTSYDGTGKSPNALDAMVFSMNGISPIKKHFTKTMELLF